MATETFVFADGTDGRAGQYVMRFGQPGQVVLCNEGTPSAIGRLTGPALPGQQVEVELLEPAAKAAPSTRTTRVERGEIGLYIGDVRIAPNREDDQTPSHVQGEFFRVLTMLVRFLGPDMTLRLPDGRVILNLDIPPDVAFEWGDHIRFDLERLADFGDAMRMHRAHTWPSAPPKEEPVQEIEPYSGLSQHGRPNLAKLTEDAMGINRVH